MSDHLNQLFEHAGDYGTNPAEAFDTNLDYEKALPGERRGLIGSFALLITNDEKAAGLQDRFDAWRERRKANKAAKRAARKARRDERDNITPFETLMDDGNFEIETAEEIAAQNGVAPPYDVEFGQYIVPEIDPPGADAPLPAVDANDMQPQRVRSEAGLYRSIHAMRTAEGAGSIDDEMAALMRGAVKRARQHLASSNSNTMLMPIVKPHAADAETNEHADDDNLVGAGK